MPSDFAHTLFSRTVTIRTRPKRACIDTSKALSAILSLPLAMMFFSGDARAADQATLDRLVSYAKEACLVGTQFDLHADVNGNITLRNLLKPGAGGALNVDKTNASGAINYIDEQLRLNADKKIQECIRPYMIRIFEVILGTNIQSSPGAPSGKLLLEPGSANMSEAAKLGRESIGIYSCSNQKESPEKEVIICFFVLTRTANGDDDYKSDSVADRFRLKLIDNFQIEHSMVNLYFLNGRGQQQSEINLEKGDAAWFAAEFADGADDISQARILASGASAHFDLHAPVKLSGELR